MSHVLGDYIHWDYGNYKKYGTNKEGSQKTNSAMSGRELLTSMRNATKRNVTNISDAAIRKIENNLNYFYGGASKGLGNFSEKQRKQMVQILMKLIQGELRTGIDFRIDPNTLAVDIPKRPGQTKYSNLGGKKGEQTTVEGIQNRIKELQERAKILTDSSNWNDKKMAQKIQNFLEDYKKSGIPGELQKVLSNSDVRIMFPGSASEQRLIQINQNAKQNYSMSAQGISKSFITDLNDLIELSYTVDEARVLGLTAEYVVALMPSVLGGQVQGSIDDLVNTFTETIKDKVKGQSRSMKVLNPAKVYGATELDMKTKSQRIGRVGARARVNTTQNKVDVELNFQDAPKVNASVKNYHIYHKNISLLKGTSLIKYLQLYPSLGNHYLNITANIRTGNSEESPEHAPMQDVVFAHNAMLVALGTHALMGGLYGATATDSDVKIQKIDQADVLIVNWRGGTTAKFKVYPVAKIIHNIEQYISVSGLSNKPSSKGYNAGAQSVWTWQNEYLPEKDNSKIEYRRCLNILTQLHTQQLEVSLSTERLHEINPY